MAAGGHQFQPCRLPAVVLQLGTEAMALLGIFTGVVRQGVAAVVEAKAVVTVVNVQPQAGHVQLPVTLLVTHFQAAGVFIAAVGGVAQIKVMVVTVAFVARRRHPGADAVTQSAAQRALQAVGMMVGVAHCTVAFGVAGRVLGFNVHQPGQGISPKAGALGATEHFNLADVGQ